MNIHIIGNGFDLAHELPTKYTDFLFFCSAVKQIIMHNDIGNKIPKEDKKYITWLDDNKKIKLGYLENDMLKEKNTYKLYLPYNRRFNLGERDEKVFEEMFDTFIKKFFEEGNDQKLIKEIIYLVYDNVWIVYFLHYDMYGEENWIDFESEISNVIEFIDNNMHGLDNNYGLYDKIIDCSEKLDKFLKTYFGKKYNRNEITYKAVRDRLESDLNKLIRAFEIYLTEYVEKIDCVLTSPNIQKIQSKKFMKVNGTPVFTVNHVLSFNYTNTYQRLYIDKEQHNKCFENHIDYIHGKADINNTIESNNMVLGIDEYLPEDRRNKDVEFIAFKKFYQRIHKQTGCKYKEWVDQIREEWESETEESKAEIRKCISKGELENPKIHKLYIFGHSLDVTDKDILRDLILNDNVYTTIFYHNKDVMGQQIANLVKVIGQDELIRRTGGSTKTIEFKQQQDMVEINS